MAKTEWRTIPDTDGRYEVSNQRTVRNTKTKKYMNIRADGITSLYIRGKNRQLSARKLMLEAFGQKQPSPKHMTTKKDHTNPDEGLANSCWIGMAELAKRSRQHIGKAKSTSKAKSPKMKTKPAKKTAPKVETRPWGYTEHPEKRSTIVSLYQKMQSQADRVLCLPGASLACVVTGFIQGVFHKDTKFTFVEKNREDIEAIHRMASIEQLDCELKAAELHDVKLKGTYDFVFLDICTTISQKILKWLDEVLSNHITQYTEVWITACERPGKPLDQEHKELAEKLNIRPSQAVNVHNIRQIKSLDRKVELIPYQDIDHTAMHVLRFAPKTPKIAKKTHAVELQWGSEEQAA